MKMSLGRKILSGFIVCTMILIAVAYFSFHNSEKYVEASQWVDHTHEILNEFSSLLTATVDAETGVRGYVISGKEAFLDPYNNSEKIINTHLSNLIRLTKDNPDQQKYLQDLQNEISKHFKYFEEIITINKTDTEKAKQVVSAGNGKRIQDKIRAIIDTAKEEGKVLLAARKKASENEARNFNLIFILLMVIIGIVLISVYLVISNNFKSLKKAEQESADKNWLLSGSFELNEKTRGEKESEVLAQAVIRQLCNYLGACIGALYLFENEHLHLAGSYAFDFDSELAKTFIPGEGLVGQAALEKKTILFTEVPENYIKVNSALGNTSPKNIILVPLLQDGSLKGVLEIGTVKTFSKLDIDFLNMVSENLAIVFSAAQSRTLLKELLEETQRQSEELEVQQEELKQTNEELIEKTGLLENSEAELKAQQEELQQSNEELEEKANLLEEQKEKLEIAKLSIENKASELEQTGKYKSEFLANMSHELRTPLNSILILSQLLSENKNKTLGNKEVEFSKNIYNSGADLLNLINEILDLSKVESGKMELEINEFTLQEIHADVSSMFSEVARNKFIDFDIRYNESELKTLLTDRQRLDQILRNLLSNAFKFTEKGGRVILDIYKADPGIPFKNSALRSASVIVAFSVTDTGIGIPEDKLAIVFEAFQQADGSTKRKYGGTGLGLSISRELANALGGEIHVKSKDGEGTTFTLYLPQQFNALFITTTAERKVEIKEKAMNQAAGRSR